MKKQRPKMLSQAKYTDTDERGATKEKDMFAIEQNGNEFVVRNVRDNIVVQSGFETAKAAWTWCCTTPVSEV